MKIVSIIKSGKLSKTRSDRHGYIKDVGQLDFSYK